MLKQKLKKLLRQSIFVKNEFQKKILEQIDVLSEQQIEDLIMLLEYANQKQIDIFERILKVDSSFFDNFKHFIALQVMESVQEEERKDRESESLEIEEEMKGLVWLDFFGRLGLKRERGFFWNGGWFLRKLEGLKLIRLKKV